MILDINQWCDCLCYMFIVLVSGGFSQMYHVLQCQNSLKLLGLKPFQLPNGKLFNMQLHYCCVLFLVDTVPTLNLSQSLQGCIVGKLMVHPPLLQSVCLPWMGPWKKLYLTLSSLILLKFRWVFFYPLAAGNTFANEF